MSDYRGKPLKSGTLTSSVTITIAIPYTYYMSEYRLRSIGIVFLTTGFFLWGFGFVYSSFWYANSDTSMLEPVRLWLSDLVRQPLLPGAVEKVLGLTAALAGILLQMRSCCGKRRERE